MTVRELKEQLGRSLSLDPDRMRVVLERYYNDLRPLTSDTKTLKMEGFFRSNKVSWTSKNNGTTLSNSKARLYREKQFVLVDISTK